MTEESDPIIDWRQLDLVCTECGAEVGSIFRDFVHDLPTLFSALEAAVTHQDLSAIAKQAHQLKGSCSTFGMARFSRLLREIEQTALQEKRAPSATVLEEAFSLFSESIRLIQQERPELAG